MYRAFYGLLLSISLRFIIVIGYEVIIIFYYLCSKYKKPLFLAVLYLLMYALHISRDKKGNNFSKYLYLDAHFVYFPGIF